MAKPKVTVVDYGLGNLMSVSQALLKVGADPEIVADPDGISFSQPLVLPGVGAFGEAMRCLRETGLQEAILGVALSGTPVLGICLGMQLMFDQSSEFGDTVGLGLIPGEVKKIFSGDHKRPGTRSTHIGWQELDLTSAGRSHSLFTNYEDKGALYFVHSYAAATHRPEHSLATVRYGGVKVLAAAAVNNVSGVQFHPEKSGAVGLAFLEKFLAG